MQANRIGRFWSRVQKIDSWWWFFKTFAESDDALPLYFVSLGGFYDLGEHLVGKYPDQINARGGKMVTPLAAALHGKHFRIAELLHGHGANVNVRSMSPFTSLHAACIAGTVDIVQWLLDHGGANVNTVADADGKSSPIASAVSRGHLQVVRMLIEFNADIDVRGDFGRGLLHMAACHCDCENNGTDYVGITQLLLGHGANLDARDSDGYTPLHCSSRWGSVEGTRLLLKYGTIIVAEDNEGRTPLQLSLRHGRQDIAVCLKEHGVTR